MNHIHIPTGLGLRKPRTEERKGRYGLTFDELFDYTTLFNDVINVGDRTVCVGPPLYGMESEIRFNSPMAFKKLDRASLLELDTTDDTLVMTYPGGRQEIQVTYKSDMFSGMDVLVTKQKNEPLHWIHEWVTYYSKEYGVRGFCFYNNNCTAYTVDEMKEYLSTIDNVTIEVLEYNVPFGPGAPWMHDYCEYVMLEHFKHKYAWCARMILHHDIDELLVTTEDITLDVIYNQLRQTDTSGIMYGTVNIDPYSFKYQTSARNLPREDVHFKDFCHYLDSMNPTSLAGRFTHTKWMLIPQMSMNTQWNTHSISNAATIQKKPRSIYMAHFFPMNSNNKNFKGVKFIKDLSTADPSELVRDTLLETRLTRAFSS